jgi:hypothetical protein
VAAYHVRVAPNEVDEIISQITSATVHFVHVNLDLAQRIAANVTEPPQDDQPGSGPAQQAWLAWTESAGDLVQISYLTAQLVDGLWGRPSSSSS